MAQGLTTCASQPGYGLVERLHTGQDSAYRFAYVPCSFYFFIVWRTCSTIWRIAATAAFGSSIWIV